MKVRKVGGEWKKFFKKKPKYNEIEEVKFLERIAFQMHKPSFMIPRTGNDKPIGIPDDVNTPGEYLEHLSYQESPEVMRMVREILGEDAYI